MRDIEILENHLKNLALIPGLSGHEQKVSDYIKNYFKQMNLQYFEDILGNNIATITGTDEQVPSIMITAHMDQVGFLVKSIQKDGFIRLERVGGIPEKTLSSLRVSIQTQYGELIPGVIGVKSHHLMSEEEKYKVDSYQEIYVDIGCSNKDEVLDLGINIGSPVIYRPFFEHMQGTCCNGTSFDNRVGCAIALTIAQKFAQNPAKATIYIAGTVQEEYTVRGAVLAVRAMNPKLIICLDVAMEGSTPDLKNASNEVVMGNGPVISLYNFHGHGTLNGVIPHPAMVRLLENTAQQKNINLQRVVTLGALTELSYMQIEGIGACGVDLDVPCRYTHSQVEVCDLEDMEKVVDLLEAAIRSIDKNFLLNR